MALGDTFSVLRGLKSRHLVPALLAALDVKGHEGLKVHAVKTLLTLREDDAHRALLYRYDELPVEAQAAMAGGVQALRNVVLEAAREGGEPVRRTVVSLLESSLQPENAEYLAEYMVDADAEIAGRAESSLRRIVDQFLAERDDSAAPLPPDRAPDQAVLRRRDKLREKQRLLGRALKVAMEGLPRHGRVWVVGACLNLGGDTRGLVNDALRKERESGRKPLVEQFLTRDCGADTLEYLLERSTDLRAEFRAVAARALAGKRGPEVNSNLAYVLDERVSDRQLRKLIAAADGLPCRHIMAGHEDCYSPVLLRRLFKEVQAADLEPIECAAAIVVLASGRDAKLSADCITALESLPIDVAGEALAHLARGSRQHVAEMAASQLVQRKSPLALRTMAELAQSPWPALAASARRYLSSATIQGLAPQLGRLDEGQLRALGAALPEAEEDFLPELRCQLQARDHRTRLQVLRLLELSGYVQSAAPEILTLIRDPEPRVRATVVTLLAGLRTPESLSAIAMLLRDDDLRVRANAVEAIEAIRDRELGRALIPLLRDPNNRIRANAAKALYTLGIPEASEVMFQMLHDGDALMRMSAAWALRQTRPPHAREWIEARLEMERDNAVRQRLHGALQTLAAVAA